MFKANILFSVKKDEDMGFGTEAVSWSDLW